MNVAANFMMNCIDPLEVLRNPEVRKYFLAVLKSERSPEEKYQSLVRFFEIEGELEKRLQVQAPDLVDGDGSSVSPAVTAAAAASAAWQPEPLLEQSAAGLRRALRRAWRTQREDGSWSHGNEPSHLWATGWTVILLHRAVELGFDASPQTIERAVHWLAQARSRWSLDADDIPSGRGNSVYEAAVAIGALVVTGTTLQPSVRRSIDGSIARLLKEQQPGGDWEATLFGRDHTGPREDKREVGATSFALRAFAASGRRDAAVEASARRALDWLGREQNPEGSWNAIASPPRVPIPAPRIDKTCDALRGFLAGQRLGLDIKPYQPIVDKAVKWILDQEEAVFDHQGRIMWAWKNEAESAHGKADDFLDNTCLTLETLLDIDTVSLPQLASNALWLLSQQRHADGNPDDGKWPNDDTGRIASAILKFYRYLRQSLHDRVPAAHEGKAGSEAKNATAEVSPESRP